MSTLTEAFRELNKANIKTLNENKNIIVKTRDGKTAVIDEEWLDYRIEGYTFIKEILSERISDEDCRRYYYDEYEFDKNPPADEIEKLICKALRGRLSLDESVSKRDDIDADADDKKERAEKELEKEKDDADSLKDERDNSAKKDFEKTEDDADADRDDKLEEGVSERNDIDADADDRKEAAEAKLAKELDDADSIRDERKDAAKKAFGRKRDDIDADKDYKLTKDDLKESDKPAAISIEDAQKWVDYDMERYGRISMRTNRLVRKAGFQIVKDDHGDYEVIVGHYE